MKGRALASKNSPGRPLGMPAPPQHMPEPGWVVRAARGISWQERGEMSPGQLVLGAATARFLVLLKSQGGQAGWS